MLYCNQYTNKYETHINTKIKREIKDPQPIVAATLEVDLLEEAVSLDVDVSMADSFVFVVLSPVESVFAVSPPAELASEVLLPIELVLVAPFDSDILSPVTDFCDSES